MRREQAASLLRRYGIIAAIVIVVALAALGGYLYWQHRAREAAAAEAVVMQGAFDQLGQEKFKEVQAPLAQLAGSGVAGNRTLARFTQADLYLREDKLKEAAAKFAEVVADQEAGQPFRDLALIRQTTAEFDTLKPEVVVDRLKGLAVPGNPWLGSAGELVAAAYLKQGRRDLAGRVYSQIAKDADVPSSVRQRAVQMAGVMGVDAVENNEGDTKQ